jgi:2-C-methyl-D-erythritol 4-phosphate cytidylyltransferase
LPKQYHLVAGHPMVLHTLAAFAGVGRLLGTLVAVAPGDHFLDAHAHPAFFVVECGGPTRADTVRGGLKALLERGAQPDDWVLVHDAARCLVTAEQIDALIDQCAGDSVGGLLAHKLADTLKTSIDGPGGVRVASTVDRSDKWLAQTPQMFRIGPLMDAIDKVGSNVTDEASAMEAMGFHPRLVPGGAQNFKVTYPDDFALAAAVLAQRAHSTTLERYGGERGQVNTAPGKKNLF